MFEGWFSDGIADAARAETTVLCPCGVLYQAELVRTVYPEDDADLLRAAKNGVLHRTRCPSCDTQVTLDAPFCLHNQEERLFLVVLPENWRHRALEARADFYRALEQAAADEPVPDYVVNALFLFGVGELLAGLGEPARRVTDRKVPSSGRRGVDELVEQVVDEMIEEVVETAAASAARDATEVSEDDVVEEVAEVTEDEVVEADEAAVPAEPGAPDDVVEDDEVVEIDDVGGVEETEEVSADVDVENEDDDADEDENPAVEEVLDYAGMDDEALLGLLDDAQHRRAAAVALVTRDSGKHLEPILRTFATLHEPDRGKFLPAVLRLGEAAVPFLLESLQGPDELAARSAARALSAMRAPGAVTALREKLAARLSGKDAETYCFALAAFGAKGREAMESELENSSWVVRAAAVRALARTRGPECRQKIEILANDRSARVRRAVREALDSLQRFADGGPTGEGPL